jgi:HAD superfamily hydrolase (TIGR01509 family)
MGANGSVKLVCFDLGGVLLRICRTWPEGCSAAGLEFRNPSHSISSETGGWFAPREINDLYQTGRITCDEFAQRLSQASGNLYSPAEIMQVHRAWILGEYPNVARVIDRIHDVGLETAALSNTNQGHWPQILRYDAVRRLRHRLASHELRLHKPDAAIYRELQRRLNRRAGEILFFDDLPENVEAARRVGWLSEQIDPNGCTATQMCEHLARHGVV